MRKYKTYGGWDRKLDWLAVVKLMKNEHEGWEKENGELMSVVVDFIWPKAGDPQHDMAVWADDNNEGHFYQTNLKTEGRTPVVHEGEKVSITFVFQLKKDAVAFKLRWS